MQVGVLRARPGRSGAWLGASSWEKAILVPSDRGGACLLTKVIWCSHAVHSVDCVCDVLTHPGTRKPRSSLDSFFPSVRASEHSSDLSPLYLFEAKPRLLGFILLTGLRAFPLCIPLLAVIQRPYSHQSQLPSGYSYASNVSLSAGRSPELFQHDT